MSRTTESHPRQCSVYSWSIASSPGQTEYIHRRVHNMVKWSEVTQSCPTLRDPTDCSLPGSSVHGIFQAGILECVAISFSRGTFRPRDWTWVSLTVGRRFTIWVTREALNSNMALLIATSEFFLWLLPGNRVFADVIKDTNKLTRTGRLSRWA